MIGVSILHLECESAACRIEAVDRIAGNERQLVDGALRDEIPIDHITEDLVDANAVLIDGEPLRRANDRRGRESSVVQIELKVVATDIADNAEASLNRFVDAAWPMLERLGLAPDASRSKLTFAPGLEETVADADFVQENGPERIDLKLDLYRRLD